MISIAIASAFTFAAQTPPPQFKYEPSNKQAETIARQADSCLSNATNLEGEGTIDAVTPSLKRGHASTHLYLKSPLTFHVEYSVLPTYKILAGTETMIARDGQFVTYSPTVKHKHRPLSKRAALPSNLIARWAIEFPALMFAGVGTHQTPFTSLVAAARAAGLNVRVEILNVNGKMVKSQDRVVIERTAKQSAASGDLEYSFVVAQPSGHIAQVTTTLRPKDKYKTIVNWSGRWAKVTEFDRTKFYFPFGL